MPFPPTPSVTPSNTPTSSVTPSVTPSITPTSQSCFPETPTPTPTVTPTSGITPTPTVTITSTPTNTPTPTGLPNIYISVCLNPVLDAGGCVYIVTYADYSPNAFGSDPAIVQDDLTLLTTLTDNVYDQTTYYPFILSGQSVNCNIICGGGPDGIVSSYTIEAINPNTGLTANYLAGGTSITGNCATCESCSQVSFEKTGIEDALFEFMDCSGVTHTFNGPDGFSATYCGVLDTALVLSGGGTIQYFDTCTDPESINPITVSLGYDASDGPTACTGATTDYYLLPNTSLALGTTIYTDYSVDSLYVVPDGFYSDGTDVYEVSGGIGQISAITSC